MSTILRLVGLGSPTALAIYAAVGLALFGSGFWSAWHLKTLEERAAEAKAAMETIAVTHEQDKVTSDVEEKAAARQVEIQTKTRTIVKEVKVYVPAKADARCIVPVGFQRLHDAAAMGLPGVPGATRKPDGGAALPDDAGTSIQLSDIASVVAGNYGSYQSVVAQLVALQGWVRAQQSVRQK